MPCFILLTLLLGPNAALGVNKCTDSSGHVSYQNEPCPVSQTSSDVAVAEQPKASAGTPTTDEVDSVILNVPGIGNVGVMTSSRWKVQLREGSPASTVKINGYQLSIQLTFIPRPSVMDEETQKANVREMAQRYVASSVEQAVQLRRLQTGIGTAVLANFNERKYVNGQVPLGEYSSITIGQINHEAMTIAVTVLTNGPDTAQHDNALLVLESILLL